MGHAFASAYQSAIENLVGQAQLPLSSFCVTEAGGNHPRAIETRLVDVDGQWHVDGQKSFVSGGEDAETLFVAAKTGLQNNGQPDLKLVKVSKSSPNVEITPMPALKFVPEVSHGKVALKNVLVEDSSILEGDGYARYIKPFRTIEDIHVLGAALGYRMGEAIANNWSKPSIELHLQLILAVRAVAQMDVSASATHIALAGLREAADRLIEESDQEFAERNPASFAEWKRDKVLLKVAEKAHLKRTQKAWETQ